MKSLRLRMTLGGAVCGAFAGVVGGAVAGMCAGMVSGDYSRGLDGALVGGGVVAAFGGVIGWRLGAGENHDETTETLHDFHHYSSAE